MTGDGSAAALTERAWWVARVSWSAPWEGEGLLVGPPGAAGQICPPNHRLNHLGGGQRGGVYQNKHSISTETQKFSVSGE